MPASGRLIGVQSTRVLIPLVPAASSAMTTGSLSSGSTALIRRSTGQRVRCQELDRLLEVLGLVHACAAELKLLPEDVEESDGLRLRVDGDDDDSAADARPARSSTLPRPQSRRLRRQHPPRPRRPMRVEGRQSRSADVGSIVSKPSSRASSRRYGLTSLSMTRAPSSRATRAMSSPIGPAADHDDGVAGRVTSPRRTSWQATASGSASAARRRSTACG